MIDRNRAWRRRMSRLQFCKGKECALLFVKQFHDPAAKPLAALKQHQVGKLTRIQELRLAYNLGNQISDGFEA